MPREDSAGQVYAAHHEQCGAENRGPVIDDLSVAEVQHDITTRTQPGDTFAITMERLDVAVGVVALALDNESIANQEISAKPAGQWGLRRRRDSRLPESLPGDRLAHGLAER